MKQIKITPILKLKILDRNAIELIKILNKDKNFIPTGASKQELKDKLNSLKEIKHSLNTLKISPILSIIEGQSGKKENYASSYETATKEIEEIKLFFGEKITDTSYLEKNKSQLASAVSNIIEHKFKDYKEFIKHPMTEYSQKKSPEQIYKEISNLTILAEKYEIPLKHPVFIAAFALLHQNPIAREIIKPKDKYKTNNELLEHDSYNPCSDLLIISRLGLINRLFNKIHKSKKIDIEFISNDENLKKFINWFNIEDNYSLKEEIKISFSDNFPKDLDFLLFLSDPDQYLKELKLKNNPNPRKKRIQSTDDGSSQHRAET